MLVGNVRKLSSTFSNYILPLFCWGLTACSFYLFVLLIYLTIRLLFIYLCIYLMLESHFISTYQEKCVEKHMLEFFLQGVGVGLYTSKWGVLQNLFVHRVSYWYGRVLKCMGHQIFGTIYCHSWVRFIQFCALSCCDSSAGGKSTCQYLFFVTFTTLVNLLVLDFTWLLLCLAGRSRYEGQSENGCTFYII